MATQPSAAKDSKDFKDERNHMEFYGTFKMDSIHGRLFELQVLIDSMKYHQAVYFAFVIIALLIWPIAAFIGILLGMLAGKDRDLQMFKVLLVLSTCVGIVLWFIPSVIVFLGGGIEHFSNLIYVRKELNFLDFVDFFLSELMILLVVVFSWVYPSITVDAEKYKKAAMQSWKERKGEYGISISFPRAQLERLRSVLKSAGNSITDDKQNEVAFSSTRSPRLTSGCLPDILSTPRSAEGDAGGTIPIQDVVSVLETLPGWKSYGDGVPDNMSAEMGEESGLFADLARISAESKEKKIWPIDIWLTKTQYYPDRELDLLTGLNVAFKNTVDMVLLIIAYVFKSPLATALLTILALARTLLPRYWLWAVLEGKFWPTDVYGAAGSVVLFSTVLTFAVSFVWIGLFYMVLMEYRRTLCQMTIISALVDARMRVKFSQSMLMSNFWFGYDSEKSEEVLGQLPLLDLRTSSNAAAFWRLREYCTLDRCNERMAVSVLLEIVIIWLLLKFAVTLGTMFAYAGLPAILCVTLFDIFVFGGMVLFALQIALQINSMMESHKQSFVEAKYEVTMAVGQLDPEKDKARRHDLDISRRLLTEYLDMTNESDMEARDSILFGMVVTPGKIVSSLGTVSAMVLTLLAKMVKNGTVHAPEKFEDELEKRIALTAHAAATSFLSIYRRAWHRNVA